MIFNFFKVVPKTQYKDREKTVTCEKHSPRHSHNEEHTMKKRESGLLDEEDRLARISQLGNPLEKLRTAIDWTIFAPVLDKAMYREPKGLGGRPPYDYVMMFKILILQEYFGLSDEQAEFQITD